MKPGTRTHWEWQWHPDSFVIWGISVVIAIFVFLVCGPTTHHGEWWWLDTLNASVLGFTILVLPSMNWLIHHPPLRRIEESVEDLREAFKQ